MHTWTQEFRMLNRVPTEPKLTGHIELVKRLSSGQVDAMIALMQHYYDGVVPEVFERNLMEKEQVIILEDATTRRIKGFSSLMRLRVRTKQGDVVAIFSGDTVIHETYRNEMVLPRLWSELAFGTAAAVQMTEPEIPVYWFLLSSSYKTYRYLPLFFKAFYPHYKHATPANIQQVMDALALSKYPDAYDDGIVRLERPTRLRSDKANTKTQNLKNPHVSFFNEINPGHAKGDDLICLAEINIKNLTSAGRRMVMG